MDCPVCGEPLIVVERESIELDHCPWCRGLWFDTGELELLAERFEGGAGPDVQRLEQVASDEKVRRCPRCSAKMDKVRAGQAPEVLLDRCPAGHGVWFDAGELGALLGQLGGGVAATATEIVSFLGETFAAVVMGSVPPRERMR